MNLYTFTVVFTPEPGEPDTFNVTVPALPEAHTFGESFEEARFMAQDCLELVILSRLERGELIPEDKLPSKLPKNARTDRIVISVVHQVSSAPASYVKSAIAHPASNS